MRTEKKLKRRSETDDQDREREKKLEITELDEEEEEEYSDWCVFGLFSFKLSVSLTLRSYICLYGMRITEVDERRQRDRQQRWLR